MLGLGDTTGGLPLSCAHPIMGMAPIIIEITGVAGLRRRRAPRNDGLVEATSRIVEITGVPDRSLNFNKIIGLNGNYPTSVIARSKHLPKR